MASIANRSQHTVSCGRLKRFRGLDVTGDCAMLGSYTFLQSRRKTMDAMQQYPRESGVHSCIAATLAMRLKLNRVFNSADRL
jgi:hypothetical protein